MRKVRITNLEHERSERTVFVHQTDGETIEVRPGREAVVDFEDVVLVANTGDGHLRQHATPANAEGINDGMPANTGDGTPPPNGEKPAQLYTEAELMKKLNAELEAMGGEGRTKAELVASILKQQEEAVAKAAAEQDNEGGA